MAVKPADGPNVPSGHGVSRPETAPPGQTNPCGHCEGTTVATLHTLPAGHGSHTAWPDAAWNAPAGQAVGEAEPRGHAWPAGQDEVGVTSPPGQNDPAVQGWDAGDVRPSAGQKKPAVHGEHCATSRRPSSLLNVPGGHAIAAEELAGQ